jgi:hypothetical protein
MPDTFEVNKGSGYRQYVVHDCEWFQFWSDHTDIRGRTRRTLTVELREEKVPEFILWLRDQMKKERAI